LKRFDVSDARCGKLGAKSTTRIVARALWQARHKASHYAISRLLVLSPNPLSRFASAVKNQKVFV